MLRAVSEPVSFFGRLGLSFSLFFRVLFDGAFARRARDLFEEPAALPPVQSSAEPEPAAEPERDLTPALQLLGLLQREGRLVDFLRQDVTDFSDDEIGAAARVVHEGCRKALDGHVKVVTVRDEDEGAQLKVDAPIDADRMKLVGNVVGSGPYEGTLRHRGWLAQDIHLPELVGDHDASVLAAAELEL